MNEHISRTKFRADFTALAYSVVAQSNQLAIVLSRLIASSLPSEGKKHRKMGERIRGQEHQGQREVIQILSAESVVGIIKLSVELALVFISGMESQATYSDVVLSQVLRVSITIP